MSTPARLGAFLLAVAAAFGIGVGVGELVGPLGGADSEPAVDEREHGGFHP